MRRNEHRNLANMSVAACCVCGANYKKYSVAWILSSCHKSLAKVFTGTMGMVVSVYAPTNVSYSAPNKDTYLFLAPSRSKCCQLDVPFLMNWAFAQQLGVLIPQRVTMSSAKCQSFFLVSMGYYGADITTHSVVFGCVMCLFLSSNLGT